MTTLNLEEIKRTLSVRQKVVQKTEELQDLVDQVFPGFQVTITQADVIAPMQEVRTRIRPDFATLSGIDQIERVLKENGEAMKLQPLYAKLTEKGGSMSLPTMMSMLSKYQKEGKFKRFGYGLWGLPSQIMGGPDE
jgi:hypothetical protein